MFVIGVPVAVSLGLSSFLVLLFFQPVPLTIVPMMIFAGVERFILIAIPLFILTGTLMCSSEMAKRLVNLCNALLGWSKGGLGAVNVFASLIFGGISGSSVADTATFGKLLVPMMVSEGYDLDYAVGITFTSSALSTIIPPSILMVLLGVVAELSIAKLLVGGIIPGILLAIGMLGINYIISTKRQYGFSQPFRLRAIPKVIKESLGPLGAPIVILGSILSGLATPTEAAAIAVLYTVIVNAISYKNFTLKKFYKDVLESAKLSASIVLIIGSATLFAWIISYEKVPELIASYILSLTHNTAIILLLINIFLLFIGMFVDAGAAVIMLVPILFPLINSLGINPIHFGVIMILNLSIGFITPPFGVCLYTICSITKISVVRAVKASVPFLSIMIIILMMLTYIPSLITYLPNLFFK